MFFAAKKTTRGCPHMNKLLAMMLHLSSVRLASLRNLPSRSLCLASILNAINENDKQCARRQLTKPRRKQYWHDIVAAITIKPNTKTAIYLQMIWTTALFLQFIDSLYECYIIKLYYDYYYYYPLLNETRGDLRWVKQKYNEIWKVKWNHLKCEMMLSIWKNPC